MAPTLFNLFLDCIIRTAMIKHPDAGVHIQYNLDAPLVNNSRHKFNMSDKVQILMYADGTKLLNISDKLNRWKEHFSQILNNKSTINPFVLNQLPLPVLKKDEETLTELSNPLSKLELRVALKQCKLDKAAGIDKLNSNITKIGNEVTVEWIKVLADKIWETESIPRDWKTQVIVPLLKTGQKSLCNNYRGISLLCVVSKVFTKALSKRIQKLLDCQLGESHCGFRQNRGFCDQIFTAK